MAAEKTNVLLRIVDVDNAACGKVCEAHDVNCMPTLALVEGGKITGKMEGVDKAKLDQWLS